MITVHLAQPRYRTAVLWMLALPVLYFISRHNYNLLHALVDGLSIVIAVCVFMIVWNTRRFLDNDYLLYVGVSFLFFALLDSIHVLGNKDMGVFPAYGNLGPALYIASRYVISISLLVAPLFIKRKLNTSLMFTVYSLFTALVLLSIFYWKNFPACIVEGVGLTPFKVISDYVICVFLLGAIGLLIVYRGSFDSRVFRIVVSSIILSVATGVAFTLYADPFGITNAVGHFFQIGSFYLVYLAIIETGLTKPQNLLYRKLKRSEEELAENVKQLDHANAGLKQEVTERKKAEARLELLTAVAERLLRPEAPQLIVEEICGMVMTHLDCQFFFNYLVETDGEGLHLNAYAGIPEEAAAAIRKLGFGVAVCGCVAQEGRRIIAQFIQQTDDPKTQLVKSYGVQAYCCHPLMAQGRLIGTLSFGTRTRPVFTPDEVGLMKSVADQVAVAMQRLLAEQAVRESEEKLRSAFANAAIGFAIAAPEGLVVDANPAFCAITGYGLEELRTMEIPQLVHPEDGAENMRLIGRMIAGKIPDFVVENRFVRKDGEPVWVRKSVSLVRKAGGAPRWTLALVEDITERKRAEEALEKAHAELTARARKLEDTNRELEGYAYTISHDLRAPLRAISGFSHMLVDDYGPSMDEEGRRRLSVIEANVVKMGTLIDDLLAFSRAGRSAMNVSRIEMSGLVAEIVETIKTLEPSSKTDIRVNGLPPALGDPALIRQALTNLLENAVKFSRKRPFPRIEVGSFKQEGEQVYFVKDNGVGFDMKYHKKLFGVFERLVSDEEFEGTGVGLAIVHRVVTRHGGRVWAEGRLDEGATIYFTLPQGN